MRLRWARPTVRAKSQETSGGNGEWRVAEALWPQAIAIGLLDKARIIAPPGYNRWLVPPAALAIHLCIGMAYGFSVFWLPLSQAIGIDHSVTCPDMTLIQALFTRTCDWRIADLGWMYTLFFVSARRLGGHLGRLARAGRSAQGRRGLGAVLVRRTDDLRARRLSASALDDVARLRLHRRHRPRPRLYLARLHPHQMVPRPARHGDRHGHHGLRRRRHDRQPARRRS